jgi:lysophospholipase L1-like esterase
MKKYILSAFGIAALMLTQSCKNDFDTDVADIKVTNGDANFTKYIALGNSLTSGYRDNALYSDGQNESYPSMIAKQMQLAGGGAFTQPMMPNNIGGFIGLPGFSGKYTLQMVDVKNSDGVVTGQTLSPVPSAPAAAMDFIGGNGKYFNNMGVPGAKSFHLVADGYGSAALLATGKANPYFVRFATSTTTSVLKDAMAQNPTFFSLWIGANDVLSYSTNGGTNSTTTGGVTTYTTATDQTGNLNPATYLSNDISDPNVVAASIKGVLDGLKSVGATKGVIANIPNVTSIPFFTRVPYNPIPLNSTSASTLNGLFGQVNSALTAAGQQARFATLTESGNNPILIVDKSLLNISALLPPAYAALGQARHATAEDLILLPASSLIGVDPTTGLPAKPTSQTIYGVTIPIADQLSLTKTEIAKIQTATNAYNSKIKALADQYGLAFVDANAKMIELNGKSGISWDGVKYSATFVTGGAFSLDGVHLTGRGYAIVANEFIKSINAKYNSTLPQVDPNKYSGVKFP